MYVYALADCRFERRSAVSFEQILVDETVSRRSQSGRIEIVAVDGGSFGRGCTVCVPPAVFVEERRVRQIGTSAERRPAYRNDTSAYDHALKRVT